MRKNEILSRNLCEKRISFTTSLVPTRLATILNLVANRSMNVLDIKMNNYEGIVNCELVLEIRDYQSQKLVSDLHEFAMILNIRIENINEN